MTAQVARTLSTITGIIFVAVMVVLAMTSVKVFGIVLSVSVLVAGLSFAWFTRKM